MTIRHPDFAPIQRRLARLGFYGLGIDDEWGPGMKEGIDDLLAWAEKERGLGPVASAPAVAPRWPKLPSAYSWLRDLDPLPRHLVAALDLLGTVERASAADSPVIMGWRDELAAAGIKIAGYSADSVPWCGLFVRYVMFKAQREGVEGPLWALNWSKWGEDGGQPELGDLLTFKRPGGGHVAFYIAEDRQGYYHVLGGNQSDAVNIMRIAKTRMHACRQPPYQSKPATVRPRIVSAGGVISENEA